MAAPWLLALLLALASSEAATVLVQTVPHGLSHAFQGLQIASALQRRNHSIVILLSDQDHKALAAREKLGEFQRLVVYSSPPSSKDKFEELLRNFQAKPREVGAQLWRC